MTVLVIILSILVLINIVAILILGKNQNILINGIKVFDEIVLKFVEVNTDFFKKQVRSTEVLNDLQDQNKRNITDFTNALKNYTNKTDSLNNRFKDLLSKLEQVNKENNRLTKIAIESIKLKGPK